MLILAHPSMSPYVTGSIDAASCTKYSDCMSNPQKNIEELRSLILKAKHADYYSGKPHGSAGQG